MADVVISNNKYTVDSLYQWDSNQTLTIYGVSLASAPEIHFANSSMKLAIVKNCIMDNAGIIHVDVPNSLLQKSQNINVYICNRDGETFKSLYKLVIPVIARERPGDYTESYEYEIYSLEALEVEVYALDADAEATVEKKIASDKVSFVFGIPRGMPGKDGDKGDPFTYEDFTEEQLENLRGKDGVSGVYVGSGDMPEGYNVQIDPDGEPTTSYYFGTENAGKLIYVGEDGYSIGITIGSGLKIVHSVLMLDGTVTPDTGDDETTAVLGTAKLGTMVLGNGGN